MIFHEIYSCYFNAVSDMIKASLEDKLDRRTMETIIRSRSFSESSININQAIKGGRWPLFLEDGSTVIENIPSTPLTNLQKGWLKALLTDPKIKLFDPDMTGLEDVEPLYTADDFIYFDRYSDSDPFDDEEYIKSFRTTLRAIKEKKVLELSYTDKAGEEYTILCAAINMEYSSKDDKFRMIAISDDKTIILNMARVKNTILREMCTTDEVSAPTRDKRVIVLELEDVNNALERAMIHFSYLEKETIKLSESRYQLTIRYFREDEAELLIQILSFGSALKVLSPDTFINKLRERLAKQLELFS
jgi:hypothetical protein